MFPKKNVWPYVLARGLGTFPICTLYEKATHVFEVTVFVHPVIVVQGEVAVATPPGALVGH